MYQDASGFGLLGLHVFTWGCFVALGCMLAGLYLLRQAKAHCGVKDAAALSCLLSLVLGLIFARLTYVLFDIQFAPYLNLSNAFDITTGGFSMYGALLGATIGGALSARIVRISILRWLDILAPALVLFVFTARLGEGATALGISRPLVTGVLDHTFLALADEYNAYLRTYLLESAAALLIFLLCRHRERLNRKPGGVLLYACLAFGISQTLFESLRYDGHLRFGFVGLQQVLSAALFIGVLLFLATRLMRQGRDKGFALLTLAALPFILGAIVGLEFMIDRSSLNKWLSYGAYVLVLVVPLRLGLSMLERNGYYG